MNYSWNEGWTLFTQKKCKDALPPMERTAKLAPDMPEVQYDLAVIRLAAGDQDGALKAIERAILLNPKLKKQAAGDSDLELLRNNSIFKELINK